MNFSSCKRYLLAGLVLPAALSAAACNRTQTGPQDGVKEEEHPEEASRQGREGVLKLDPGATAGAGIQTVNSRLLTLTEYLETTGVVAVDESGLARIRPLSKGIVERIFVLRGDDVERGEPLVQYDNIEVGELAAEYKKRRTELSRARTQLEVRHKLWQRGKELFAGQAMAEKELDLREAEYRNAQETVRGFEAEIKEVEDKLRRYGVFPKDDLEPDELASASSTTLPAPFAGTIIDYAVAEGEVVSPGEVMMSLADLSTVWVLADIYEKDIGFAREGIEVDLFFPSYPDQTFKGRLTYLGDVVDPKTRTVKVRCEVPNPRRRLKLGLFAGVRIPGAKSREVPSVPVSALQTIEGEETVFIEKAPALFEKRGVRRGPEQDGWVAIEEGVLAGEKVVTEGSFALKSEWLRERLGGGHAH